MQQITQKKLSIPLSKEEVLQDYQTAVVSRIVSLMGRKEVLNGKAKFGIFGDGKELAQLAMAHAFKKGDWRSGYYRDQTFMFASKTCDVKQFFAQLYANTDQNLEPNSAGRQMNCHFASRTLDDQEALLDLTQSYNISSDISPTGGQMARLLGLAYASKQFRTHSDLQKKDFQHLSLNGNEVAFGTIGNGATSEGLFWETVNAAGVLQVPMVLSIWDDGYGISVPNSYQSTKGDIGKLLLGFESEEDLPGIDLYQIDGFDYPSLVSTYQAAVEKSRSTHRPCIIHVKNMTQPQGHSTSGSHERYKSQDRLNYESEFDCNLHFKKWLLDESYATENELLSIEKQAEEFVKQEMQQAWIDYQSPIKTEASHLIDSLKGIDSQIVDQTREAITKLTQGQVILRRQIQASLEQMRLSLRFDSSEIKQQVSNLIKAYKDSNSKKYNTFLYADKKSCLKVKGVQAKYDENPPLLDGRQIILKFFDSQLQADPRIFIIGEDIGKLGGVNLEFEGLNEKHGEHRVTDTGIREATILGQGIGAAMRGLRPIADIQYLDYLLFCIQGMSDDLATLHYRTAGGQCAPLIVRTKGHRLEGVWHTGSPLGMILNSTPGMYVCVPRNFVQAAGMYKTLLSGNDPALVIEVLSGYRIKEKCPSNIGEYTVTLGLPEILSQGSDITLVTYGANVRLAQEALPVLNNLDISVEIIDVQTLEPFDIKSIICGSIQKTNAVLFFDEDVPGGSSAYMMQKVLVEQNAYQYLDCPPKTLTAQPHRAAYGSDGDYFSKPNKEDLITSIYEMMRERNPTNYPSLNY